MRKLSVYIEINGKQHPVGSITGESYRDAVFAYDREYMDSEAGAPVSVSLPFREDAFSPEMTRCFFESLLPEGFSRRVAANWVKADENDYLTILAALGSECLGAIKVTETGSPVAAHYEKLSESEIKELASEGATKSTQILMQTHLSLAGASGKVGLYLDKEGKWYLPKGDAPSTHIVKQSHVRLGGIVLNEQLCMLAAGKMGIDVPETFIVDSGNAKDEDVLFAVRRYDRVFEGDKTMDGLPVPLRLHQEDFAQALGISSDKKYENEPMGYLEKMFELMRKVSADPISDQRKLIERIIFNYLIGNTDCHLKNHALVYDPGLKSVRLAPAYDIVATRVYNTTSDMSFFIGGERDIGKIDRRSFLRASGDIGISPKMMEDIFDKMADGFEGALNDATEELVAIGFETASELKKRIMTTWGRG